MMAESSKYSDEVKKYVAAITSSIDAGGLPSFSYKAGDEWKKLTDDEINSDMIAQLNIFKNIFNEIIVDGNEDELMEYINTYDLDEKRVKRALEQFPRICKIAGLDPKYIYNQEIVPPNEKQLEEINQCIFSGMVENIYIRRGKEDNEPAYENADPMHNEIVRRNISNRSVNEKPFKYVAGMPYHFNYFKGHEKKTRNVLEYTTNISDIGRAVLVMVDRYPKSFSGFVWDGRQVVEEYQVSIGDSVLERSNTTVSEYKDEVAEILIKEYVSRVNKSKAVVEMFALLDKVNKLNDKDPEQRIQRFGEGVMKDILKHEAVANMCTSGQELDSVIYLLLQNKEFNDNLLPEEIVEDIEAISPDNIEFNGEVLDLSYKKGEPIVRKYKGDITEDVFLDDGREVKFEIRVRKKNTKKGGAKNRICSGSDIERIRKSSK